MTITHSPTRVYCGSSPFRHPPSYPRSDETNPNRGSPPTAAACGLALLLAMMAPALAGTTQTRYYAHETVEDADGVIAPWYSGQNGQCDLRVRIAAETLKRYPWTDTDKAVAAAPEYVFSGAWRITPEGQISVPPIKNWANGDLGQRSSYVLGSLIDYYRYSGDAAAIGLITIQADALLDHCLTPSDHRWPGFLISVPTKGKPYGQCDPHGFIQLDIVAEVGVPLIHASHLTGNKRYLEAARHWGDLFAEKRNREPGMPPWPRYANPEDVQWEDHMTGGIVFILDFLDELIRTGYTGKDNAIVEARNAGVAYLRDVLLPDWTGPDTWGRNYWDWPCPVQVENVTEFVARYLMEHPDEFPNWENDVRNIMSLFLNRTSVSPKSNGDVFSGAWAYPESAGCCGRSLWYGPMELANVYAQYGVLADSEWGRELARRQILLATYDVHETGVVEDNIDGGQIVAGNWFKIAHPMALKHALAAMAWLPETLGPSRENHIMRSTGVIRRAIYRDGLVAYTTHHPDAPSTEVLRLAFRPDSVEVSNERIPRRDAGSETRYRLEELPDGDHIVTVHHYGSAKVVIRGDDPQEFIPAEDLTFAGNWELNEWHRNATDLDRYNDMRVSTEKGATMTCTFTGNQVRVIGSVLFTGGLADVYLDNVQQLAGIDGWNPEVRHHQVLYHRNGLTSGEHTIKVVVRGDKNPISENTKVLIEGVQFSAATPKTGRANFGQGGGPTNAQRFIFGYNKREDYVDADGNAWRPGTEFVVRSAHKVDSVPASWWTERRRLHIPGTPDPELYRYGVHGREFTVNFTVGPGSYHARLKFCETRNIKPKQRAVTIHINDEEKVANMDIAATAGGQDKSLSTKPDGDPYTVWSGLNRAVDLVFNDIKPKNGVIAIRFSAPEGGEAIVQAIEIAPEPGAQGAKPVTVAIEPPKEKSE